MKNPGAVVIQPLFTKKLKLRHSRDFDSFE